ncbi:MAG: ribonuclease Y [Clostridia bacterium]|nr:ribonuclease Y [Clostridia bacterium]
MGETLKLILCSVGAALIGVLIGILSGIAWRKAKEKRLNGIAEENTRIAAGKISAAEEKARKIEEEARVKATLDSQKMIVDAQREINRQRSESEREIKERRAEVSRSENRLTQKEAALDKKTEQLEKKNETLDKKLKDVEAVRQEAEEALEKQQHALEEISGLSVEEARERLMAGMEEKVKFEFAQRLCELEEEFKETSDEKARNIITLAIQRCAVDQVSESTVSTVQIPNEEMKGRIIGREGRNIQKLETLTGVELIIDDTPDAITVSGFDPVRREIARQVLEKLISDGRIHPARIEEMYEKVKREVEAGIKQAGERATFEVGVHGLNPELVKLLGRLRYRTSYGQNVLRHSVEVAFLSGIMAEELGADAATARRAGLLHDIGKAFPHDVEGTHVEIGVNAAKKYKESREVIHAIEAHHNDVEPKTAIAVIVQAADAISAARPGARREDLENYIKRLEKLEEIATGFRGVEKAYAIQAGRELRVMIKPEDVSDQGMVVIARDIAQKIKEEVKYPGQIKVNLIRESRAVDYAK